MKLFSKIFNKEKQKELTKVQSDDSFLNTEVLMNACDEFIILISFTEDYFHDMIEFLSTCNEVTNTEVEIFGAVKYVHSSYDEESGKKDTHDDPIYIVHNRHYLLIGGDDFFYRYLFEHSDNIANSILTAIKNEIVQYRRLETYQILVDDMIITEPFKYGNTVPEYTEYTHAEDSDIYYTDPSLLMSKLPNCFTAYDIIQFLQWTDENNEAGHKRNLYLYLDEYMGSSYIMPDDDAAMYNICMSLFKNHTYETLKAAVGPKYRIQDDDAMPGDVTDESLDELFQQKYESVSVLKSDEIEYTDIDEQLSDEPIDTIPEEDEE